MKALPVIDGAVMTRKEARKADFDALREAINRQIAEEIAAYRMPPAVQVWIEDALAHLEQLETATVIRGALAAGDRTVTRPVYVLARRLRKAIGELLKKHGGKTEEVQHRRRAKRFFAEPPNLFRDHD